MINMLNMLNMLNLDRGIGYYNNNLTIQIQLISVLGFQFNNINISFEFLYLEIPKKKESTNLFINILLSKIQKNLFKDIFNNKDRTNLSETDSYEEYKKEQLQNNFKKYQNEIKIEENINKDEQIIKNLDDNQKDTLEKETNQIGEKKSLDVIFDEHLKNHMYKSKEGYPCFSKENMVIFRDRMDKIRSIEERQKSLEIFKNDIKEYKNYYKDNKNKINTYIEEREKLFQISTDIKEVTFPSSSSNILKIEESSSKNSFALLEDPKLSINIKPNNNNTNKNQIQQDLNLDGQQNHPIFIIIKKILDSFNFVQKWIYEIFF